MNSKILITTVAVIFCAQLSIQAQNPGKHDPISLTDKTIMEHWHSGKTLPVEMTRQYPWPDLGLKNDNGVNVLVDLSHQCTFANMWNFPRLLHEMGYRAIGNTASLHTVLEKGGQSRIRAYYERKQRIYPFAWWDNPEFNVVYTEQVQTEAQEYTNAEIDALEQFVAGGGGLVIVAVPQKPELMATWSINKLAKRFGMAFGNETDKYFGTNYAVVEGREQEPLLKGEGGKPIVGIVQYGKGYVVLSGHSSALKFDDKDADEAKARVKNFLADVLQEVSRGKEPVGGKAEFPVTMGGGGAIYPELEQQMDKIVLYYAANQKPELLKCVNEDVPLVMKKIEQWLPSKSTDEPMYLILAAGGGGGWAVNAFKPKENGIISLDARGVLSIFAHELAHTMGGPRNAKGEIAGQAPLPNQGEAHAGWFQGKIDALFDTTLLQKSNRNCNDIFKKEGALTEMDLTKVYETEEGRKIWGHGTDWQKVWYIWQKLDDRYGPTWYPRWKWIQHNRWADTPNKRLTWDEMVEDMSIAVGEDLFPFMAKLGITLDKQRLEKIKYDKKEMTLNIALIEPTPAGNVRIEDIGDYTLPLNYPKSTFKYPKLPLDIDNAELVFVSIRDMPVFNGDKTGEEFEKYIFSQVIYPKKAQKKDIVGSVGVTFIVDEDGFVVNTEVNRKVHPLLDAEALRVIESSPKWSPGISDGKPVRVSLIFNIDFGQPYKPEVKEYVDLLKKRHIAGSKYKYGQTHGAGWTSLPAFRIEDIDELLKYRNDTTLITYIPHNSSSSLFFPDKEHEVRMIVLWTIESIRVNAIVDNRKDNLSRLHYGRFPSLNPWIGLIGPSKIDENKDKKVNLIVSDAYFKWWMQNKDKSPEETLRMNPLQDTNYKWL